MAHEPHHQGHAHEHSHGGIFAEQLSTISVSAMYAGIMLLLFWFSFSAQRDQSPTEADRTVLSIIANWIQWMVFLGGALLLGMVVLRAIALWLASKRIAHAHHHHDHDHAHDHDHSWSPMKFIPLVFPVVMFFLGLPNDRMIRALESDIIARAGKGAPKIEVAADPIELSGSLGIAKMGQFGMTGVGSWEYGLSSALSYVDEEIVLPVDTRTDLDMLEKIAKAPALREQWKTYRRVEVEGMFNRVAVLDQGQTLFSVVRLRIACCISDARPASMPAFSRKKLDKIANGEWVAVQGRLDFQNIEGKLQPVMRVFQVKKARQPANPYLQ
jgi:uncharacterized repeat protein (TIGR03943 family)